MSTPHENALRAASDDIVAEQIRQDRMIHGSEMREILRKHFPAPGEVKWKLVEAANNAWHGLNLDANASETVVRWRRELRAAITLAESAPASPEGELAALRNDLARISGELGLPPKMGPAPGWLKAQMERLAAYDATPASPSLESEHCTVANPCPAIAALLQDPAAVWTNMLRGTIARPAGLVEAHVESELAGALRNLHGDCCASDFNEHWDCYTEAGKILARYDAQKCSPSLADELASALRGLLNHYVGLVNSGDAGHWNPESEPCVIAARKALDQKASP